MVMSTINDVHELQVYQEAMELTTSIYKITDNFPKSEQFGLASQIQRAAVSVPSNIAEGFERSSDIDFKRFLVIARGSIAEVRTQLEIARELKYLNQEKFNDMQTQITNIHKLINGLIRHLKKTS